MNQHVNKPLGPRLWSYYLAWRRANAIPKVEVIAAFAIGASMFATGAVVFSIYGTLKWPWTTPCMFGIAFITSAAVHWLAPDAWKRLPPEVQAVDSNQKEDKEENVP